jgi:hypothetical protein
MHYTESAAFRPPRSIAGVWTGRRGLRLGEATAAPSKPPSNPGKGDVVVVPNGTPHRFTEVGAPFFYYVVKVTS